MTKREMVCSILKDLGFEPEIDEDGDVRFLYQLKTLYVMIGDENENFLVIMLPQFYKIEDGEDTLIVTTCNMVTRDIKMVKVYVDNTCKYVTASCEFFYTNEDTVKLCFTNALKILGIVRTSLRNTKKELSESE